LLVLLMNKRGDEMTSYPRDNKTLLDNGGYRIVVAQINVKG